MKLHPLAALLVLAVTLKFSARAVAQVVPGLNPILYPLVHDLTWPAQAGTGTVRKIIGQYWDTHDRLSMTGVRGLDMAKATAPAFTPSIAPFQLNLRVVDMITLPMAGLGATETRDAVLVSVMGGAAELHLLYAANDGSTVDVPVAHTGWQRAAAMTMNWDAAGIDIAARADGALPTLLRTRYDYASGLFTQVPAISVADAIRDLCVFDYNADGVHDVGVLTDSALTVYDVGGAVLFTRPLAHPGGAIERVPQAGLRRALALLERNSSNTGWQLVHITNVAIETPLLLQIAELDFTLISMTSGDLDADQDFDVVIQANDRDVLLVTNLAGPATHFGASTNVAITIGEPGGIQYPGSLLDYNYDGAADLLAPVRVGSVDHLVLDTGLSVATNPPAALIYSNILQECDYLASGALVLNLSLSGDLAEFEQIQVTAYTGSQEDMYAGLWATKVGEPMIFENEEEPALQIPVQLSEIQYTQLLFLEVQFSSATVYTKKPTFLICASLDMNQLGNPFTFACQWLSAYLLPGHPARTVKHTPTSGGGRQRIGLVGSQRSIPYE